MNADQFEGLISLGLGVLVILFATGVLKARVTREGNAAFLKKWRWLLILTSIFLLVRGAMQTGWLPW